VVFIVSVIYGIIIPSHSPFLLPSPLSILPCIVPIANSHLHWAELGPKLLNEFFIHVVVASPLQRGLSPHLNRVAIHHCHRQCQWHIFFSGHKNLSKKWPKGIGKKVGRERHRTGTFGGMMDLHFLLCHFFLNNLFRARPNMGGNTGGEGTSNFKYMHK
jgi:hypothetical protein